jgi:hypothetical protein
VLASAGGVLMMMCKVMMSVDEQNVMAQTSIVECMPCGLLFQLRCLMGSST